MSRPAVFVDRDGTLLEETRYLSDPEDASLIPGAAQALCALRDDGFVLVCVTNQAGVARGYYGEGEYRAVAARLEELLDADGARLDATYVCFHHPDFTGPCDCRKPHTGMYLEAAEDLDLDVSRSFYIGDKVSDVLAAFELGGQGVLVRTGHGPEHVDSAPEGVWVTKDVLAAAKRIHDSTQR